MLICGSHWSWSFSILYPSCSVSNGIYKGVGHRKSQNSSKDEYFEEAVEYFSDALAVSGFKKSTAKEDLLKYKQGIEFGKFSSQFYGEYFWLNRMQRFIQ